MLMNNQSIIELQNEIESLKRALARCTSQRNDTLQKVNTIRDSLTSILGFVKLLTKRVDSDNEFLAETLHRLEQHSITALHQLSSIVEDESSTD